MKVLLLREIERKAHENMSLYRLTVIRYYKSHWEKVFEMKPFKWKIHIIYL